VLWLNPSNHNTFPPGLIEAVTLHNNGAMPFECDATETAQSRMRKQMQADALQPLKNEGEEEESLGTLVEHFPPDLMEEITQFFRLQVSCNCISRVDLTFCHLKAQDRLGLVLAYLRDKHAYCFWCGIEYGSIEEMESQCPGPEEEDHD
jgi:hypothetical protein